MSVVCGHTYSPLAGHAVPAGERDSRDTLVAAANAYLDAFLEGKIDRVPWGFPCVRVEGGAYTGKGTPADSCEVFRVQNGKLRYVHTLTHLLQSAFRRPAGGPPPPGQPNAQ